MAENESLVIRESPQLQRVHRAVQACEPIEKVVEKARSALYLAFRAIQEDLPIDKVSTPDDLVQLISQSGKHRQSAILLQSVIEPGMSVEQAFRAWVAAVREAQVGQVEDQMLPTKAGSLFAESRSYCAEIREQLERDDLSIANNLVSGRTVPPKIGVDHSESTSELLNESLLWIDRK